MLNIINIKKCGSVMDEDLNPKVKVKGSSPCFYKLWYLGHLA
jgi:hypothetical protein